MLPAAMPLATTGPSSPDAEEELLRRFAADDDRDAFEQLVLRLAPVAYRVARVRLPDPADVDDAVQEAFISVMRGARSYRSGAGVRAWVSRIVINAGANVLRERQRRQRRHLSAPPPAPPALPLDTDVVERLRAAMSRLPEALRLAVHLHHCESLPLAEVARATGVGLRTAQSRVRLGLERLRAALGRAAAANLAVALAAMHQPTCPPPLLAALVRGARGPLPAPIAPRRGWIVAGAAAIIAVAAIAWLLVPPMRPAAPAAAAPPLPAEDPPRSAAVSVRPLWRIHAPPTTVRTRVSADGKLIAVWATAAREAAILPADDPERPLLELPGAVWDIAFSDDGARIAWISGLEQRLVCVRAVRGPGDGGLRTVPAPPQARQLCFGAGTHVVAASGAVVVQLDPGAADGAPSALAVPGAAVAPAIDGGPNVGAVQLPNLQGASVMMDLHPSTTPRERADEGVLLAGFAGGAAVANIDHDRQLAPVLHARETRELGLPPPAAQSAFSAALRASAGGRWLVESCAWNLVEPAPRRLVAWSASDPTRAVALDWPAGRDGTRLPLPGAVLPLDDGRVLIASHDGLLAWRAGGQETPTVLARIDDLRSVQPWGGDRVLCATGDRALLVSLRDGTSSPLPVWAPGALAEQTELALDQDGRYLALADAGGTVQLWDLAAAQLAATLPAAPGARGGFARRTIPRFDHQRRALVLAHGETVSQTHADWTLPDFSSPDARLLERCMGLKQALTLDTVWRVERWDLADGERRELLAQPARSFWHWMWSFACNERWAVALMAQGLVRYDLREGRALPPIPLTELGAPLEPGAKPLTPAPYFGNGLAGLMLTRLSLAPGSDRLLLEGQGSVFIDLSAGRVDATLPSNRLDDAAFSPAGPWLVGTDQQKLYLIALPEAEPILHGTPAIDVAWEPTGARFAARTADNLVIVELPQALRAAGVERQPLAQRSAAAKELRVVRQLDAGLLAAGSESGSGCTAACGVRRRVLAGWSLLRGGGAIAIACGDGVRVIDVATGDEAARLVAFGDGGWAAITADGWFSGSPGVESRLSCDHGALAQRRDPARVAARLRELCGASGEAWQIRAPAEAGAKRGDTAAKRGDF